MWPWKTILPASTIILQVVSFLIILPYFVESFFGLTARKPVLSLVMDLTADEATNSALPDGRTMSISTSKICGLLKLTKQQTKMCKRAHGIAETLVDATKLSILECQFQFQYERWNCSLGKHRTNLLKKGFKETAYLYAISSAGIVHSFARACSRGKTDKCTCDESFNSLKTREAWLWGGCGDNIKFGQRFTKRLMAAAKKMGKDLRAKFDQHNTNLGMRVVRKGVAKTCKCHGVSGSCAVQTCWRRLAAFHDIGRELKYKYENAIKVGPSTNQAKGKTSLVKINNSFHNLDNPYSTIVERSPLRKNELIFLDESPTFCKKSRYSAGTSSRVCNKETNCDAMCCGNGYNVQNRILKKACQCQVIWCCYVECKQCLTREEIYMCK